MIIDLNRTMQRLFTDEARKPQKVDVKPSQELTARIMAVCDKLDALEIELDALDDELKGVNESLRSELWYIRVELDPWKIREQL